MGETCPRFKFCGDEVPVELQLFYHFLGGESFSEKGILFIVYVNIVRTNKSIELRTSLIKRKKILKKATLTFQYKAPKPKPMTREKTAGSATAAHCRLESPMEFKAFPVI